MKTLTIALPTKSSIQATTVMSLLSALTQIGEYKIQLVILPGKSNIDQARSILITNWYDNSDDTDLFLFVDADQTFKPEDIYNLIKMDGDVNVGVYLNRANKPTCFPVNPEKFFSGEDNELYYGATGFMMIKRPILKDVIKYLQILYKRNDEPRYWISENTQNIIPFFTQRFIKSEIALDSERNVWLGEDYGFCWLVRQCGGTIKGYLSPTIGHDINDVKFMKSLKKKSIWHDKSIVYFTGRSKLKWSFNDMDNKGLTGSESAVIQLSKNWAQLGYSVTVYGNCEEGINEGVQYLDVSKFNPVDDFNILILWRGFSFSLLQNELSYNKLYVDLHDIPQDHYLILSMHKDKIDNVFVKSEFHKSKLYEKFGDDELNEKVVVIENGINTELLDLIKDLEFVRNKNKLLYTSSYVRGIEKMLEYGFPYIKKHCPDVEFHVCYGMELIVDNKFKNRMNKLLKQDGVYHHGKVNHFEIAKHRYESSIHYYVGSFEEIDCISMKEALYCGCQMVTSTRGVFGERHEYLHTIEGDADKEETQLNAAKYIVNMLQNGYEEKKRYQFKSWTDVAKEWNQYFKEDDNENSENSEKMGENNNNDDPNNSSKSSSDSKHMLNTNEVFIQKKINSSSFDKMMYNLMEQNINVNNFKVYRCPDLDDVSIESNEIFINLSDNEILEHMSHINIWNYCIANNVNTVLIMNDTVNIDSDFVKKINKIYLPTDYDIFIITSGNNISFKNKMVDIEVNNVTNIDGYYITQYAMKKILSIMQSEKITVPFIKFLNNHIHYLTIYDTPVCEPVSSPESTSETNNITMTIKPKNKVLNIS